MNGYKNVRIVFKINHELNYNYIGILIPPLSGFIVKLKVHGLI